jgi:DNA-binding MarR family transcriptional regulator
MTLIQKKYLLKCPPLCVLMSEITKKYYGALSKKLEHIGIDRYFYILVIIDKSTEKCTQQYISNSLNIDKVNMVGIINYLVAHGMILRKVNSLDRREHLIELTQKAKNLMPKIYTEIDYLNNTALNGLNKNEKKIFLLNIDTILKNIENLPVNEVHIKLKKK